MIFDGRRLSVVLTHLVFVLANFVGIDLIEVGGFVVSVQKLAAFVLLPLAVFLMAGRFIVSYWLTMFLALNLYIFLFPALIGVGDIMVATPYALSVILSFLSVTLVYTTCSWDPYNLRRLFILWVYFAIFSSFIAMLQAFGLAPLFTVPSDLENARLIGNGLVRATGLKQDPNFLALMLVLAVPMLYGVFNSKVGIWFGALLLLIGIAATQSRMGILLWAAAFTISYVKHPTNYTNIYMRRVTVATICFITIPIIMVALPPNFKNSISNRFSEVSAAVMYGEDAPRNDAGNITSAVSRILLAEAGIKAGVDRWAVGWGAGNTEEALNRFSSIDLNNVSHNTYIEYFVIGGVPGLFFVIYYLQVSLRRIRKGIRLNKNRDNFFTNISSVSENVVWVYIGCSFFLSLTYTAIIWLPILIGAVFYRWSVTTRTSELATDSPASAS